MPSEVKPLWRDVAPDSEPVEPDAFAFRVLTCLDCLYSDYDRGVAACSLGVPMTHPLRCHNAACSLYAPDSDKGNKFLNADKALMEVAQFEIASAAREMVAGEDMP